MKAFIVSVPTKKKQKDFFLVKVACHNLRQLVFLFDGFKIYEALRMAISVNKYFSLLCKFYTILQNKRKS